MKLDDVDITASLQEVRLTMGQGQINEAEVRFMPSEVEVDASALATLEAHIEAQVKP